VMHEQLTFARAQPAAAIVVIVKGGAEPRVPICVIKH